MAKQHFYRRMTQGNYSSNYTLPPCIVILKVGILIKTDADFYNGSVEKKEKYKNGEKTSKKSRPRAATVAMRRRAAGGGRGVRGLSRCVATY